MWPFKKKIVCPYCHSKNIIENKTNISGDFFDASKKTAAGIGMGAAAGGLISGNALVGAIKGAAKGCIKNFIPMIPEVCHSFYKYKCLDCDKYFNLDEKK